MKRKPGLFRKFLIVKLEVGKELYFRFYDHRVLRIFLPTCYEKQLKYFFGLIKVFAMESEDAEFELKNGLWISKKISKQDFWNRLNVGVCSITVVFNTIKLQKSYENGDMLK